MENKKQKKKKAKKKKPVFINASEQEIAKTKEKKKRNRKKKKKKGTVDSCFYPNKSSLHSFKKTALQLCCSILESVPILCPFFFSLFFLLSGKARTE